MDEPAGDTAHASITAPTTYHHEIVPEFNEGESQFLHLTPDDRP